MFDIQPVRGSDPVLKKLLDGAGLPTDDLEDAGRMFFLAASEGSVFGSGGFETAGGDILLRSIAVDPDHRGRGIGKTLTLDVLDRARQGGAVRAFLLTTSAARSSIASASSVSTGRLRPTRSCGPGRRHRYARHRPCSW